MPRSALSDEALAFQFRDTADPALFAELMQRHQANVIRQCQHYVRDYATAQDLSQEVFMRVHTKIHTFQGKSSYTTWQHTIVERRCLDHLKNDKTKMNQEISERIIATLAEEWEDESDKLTIEILQELMKKISGEDKHLLTKKYQENWSVKEIKQALGLSESVIKTRLHRIKAKLHKLLEER